MASSAQSRLRVRRTPLRQGDRLSQDDEGLSGGGQPPLDEDGEAWSWPAPPRTRAERLWSVLTAIPWPLATGLAIFGLWELIVATHAVDSVIIPYPISVIKAFYREASTHALWSNVWVTVQEAFIGWGIGSSGALLVGIGIALSRRISKALYPYVISLQTMPHVVLVPVFIVVFGFNMPSRIALAIVICFFPVVVNTIAGLTQPDEYCMLLFMSFSASRFTTFRRLLFPSALPYIMAGLKTALTLGFVGAIVSELQSGTQGIGVILTTSTDQVNMPAAFGYIVWITLVAVVAYMSFDRLEKVIVFWREQVRRVYKFGG